MEKETSQVYVAHFFGETPTEGKALEAWPNHLTLVKPFRLMGGLALQDVVTAVSSVGEAHAPLLLTPVGLEDVGPHDNEPAFKIERTEALHKLHLDLVHAIEGLGIVFADICWMLEDYNPHSTIQGDFELGHGRVCDSLSVSAWSMGQRVVARTVMLSGNMSQGAPC